ncbi:MAG: efflux RND transporter periplasmic adaptor subunit [Betaproteobacteria bacterium]|nr:efflux RND transporter periplasmic adaptor subunit [Betaproteobacteria bacterium]
MDNTGTNSLPPLPDKTPVTEQAAKPRPPARRRLIWVAAIGIAIVIGGVLVWHAFFHTVTVSLAPTRSNVREQVFGLGEVGARVQSNVGFKVAGVLAQLDVDEGDRVHAGQVLARLDAKDVEAQVAVAQANIAQAQANIHKARADVTSAAANLTKVSGVSKRDRQLIQSGLVSTEQDQADEAAVQVAAANLAVAHSALTQAVAALRSARAQEAFEKATLANYTIHAPFDGWVISRNLELGDAVTQGQSVFTLVKTGTVWAVGYVDERLAGWLHVGQPARIVLRSEPTQRFPGHVARIEIESNAVNEERVVDVAFDHLPRNIHLAEQAEVYITTGTLKQTVLVPQTAAMEVSGNSGKVWILDKGRLAKTRVTFGPQLLDGRLPVVSGVPAGAAVVLPKPALRVGEAAHAARGGAP